MKAIQVSGTLYIEDDEYDPGPNGPLTEAAFLHYMNSLGLDDIEFAEVPDK